MKREEYLRDAYARRAEREGVGARSYYKLEELDRSYGLLRAGQRLVDLGAHPGGWLRYIGNRLGGEVSVTALDRQELSAEQHGRGQAFKSFSFICGDIMKLEVSAVARVCGHGIDGLLSDLAPQTTGIRDRDAMLADELARRGLEFAEGLLRRGGFFVAKCYSHDEVEDFCMDCRKVFGKVRRLRLKVTRKGSREIFILAENFMGRS